MPSVMPTQDLLRMTHTLSASLLIVSLSLYLISKSLFPASFVSKDSLLLSALLLSFLPPFLQQVFIEPYFLQETQIGLL